MVQLRMALADRGLATWGNKACLQQRLLDWTAEQKRLDRKQQHQPPSAADHWSLNSGAGLYQTYGVRPSPPSTNRRRCRHGRPDRDESATEIKSKNGVPSANSLAEWTRTVDLKPLLQRREAIYKERERGKGASSNSKYKNDEKEEESSLMSKDEYISVLKKVFDQSSPSRYSNYEVQQMYAASKEADQLGDRALSKRILNELKEVTPHDARVVRRLSRMEKEEGNLMGARALLWEGLETNPHNAYLWQGLAQVASTDAQAVEFYEKAIRCDPTLPMSYHALGTLQHTKGRIASAMKTLKEGLEYCPSNHRLHHALGDIYRDAKLLSMAEKCYRKALKHGPEVSHGFAYTALAYTAYEDDKVDQCRMWLEKSVALNDGRNANGWVSWAQMEEAEGDIEAARNICIRGIAQYEQTLLKRASSRFRKASSSSSSSWKARRREFSDASNTNASAIRNRLMARVPVYRSGDRFFNLYRNWARLEERYGTPDSVAEVYRRAVVAFPHEWKLALDWAQYHARLNLSERARELFAMACTQSAGQHGDAYRCWAEYEMAHGHYDKAQEILLQGAVAFSQRTASDETNRHGMIELYYVWAICEWQLGHFARAETLLDHALRSLGPDPVPLKCRMLFAKAQLHYDRGEPLLAQHCIGLCFQENVWSSPDLKHQVWTLWFHVATDVGNGRLSAQCRALAQATATTSEAPLTVPESDSSPKSTSSSTSSSRLEGRPHVQQLMRRDPWHMTLFGSSTRQRGNSYESVVLPTVLEEEEEEPDAAAAETEVQC